MLEVYSERKCHRISMPRWRGNLPEDQVEHSEELRRLAVPHPGGLPENVKTRSLKIMAFVSNTGLVKNDNQGRAILSHFTGIRKTDFINTDTFCKRLH